MIGALNRHLTAAATAINEYDGLIDKYDGDTVMALYNTPLNPQKDHIIRAVKTALGVRDPVMKYQARVYLWTCQGTATICSICGLWNG